MGREKDDRETETSVTFKREEGKKKKKERGRKGIQKDRSWERVNVVSNI